MFKTKEPPKTWAERAADVPDTQRTWIVALGEIAADFKKVRTATDEIDGAVAEIEAAGWRLDQMVPGPRGVTSSSVGGSIDTAMLGVFRRA